MKVAAIMRYKNGLERMSIARPKLKYGNFSLNIFFIYLSYIN